MKTVRRGTGGSDDLVVARPVVRASAEAEAGALRASVVITNHNYGHFLEECIESVLAQTRPPDEIIIVDDASSDGSDVILDVYADRAEIVRHREGRGQAAAFNSGARLATGDVVLFLDADDLWRPEALEVVLAHHGRHLGLVFFGLEIIDADGRSRGLHRYSLDGDDGDNRPRLLRQGTMGPGFSFAPTSANAFSRDFIDWALPMPEAGWRICADAYLVRAAALFGQVRAIRRVLGAYRIHGGNNYTRADATERWRLGRWSRDLDVSWRALAELAEKRDLAADAAEADATRLALRLRALDDLATLGRIVGRGGEARRYLAKVVRETLGGALPRGERLAAAAYAVGVARAAGRRRGPPGAGSPNDRAPLRRWGGAGTRLAARLGALERPRWREALAIGAELDFRERGAHFAMLADGWRGEGRGQTCCSRGERAALEFLLEPARGVMRVGLRLGVPLAWREEGLRLVATVDGEQVASLETAEEAVLPVHLDRDPLLPLQTVRIEISCEGAGPLKRRAAQPFFCLHSLTVHEVEPEKPQPFLVPGEPVGFGSLAARGSGWIASGEGAAVGEGHASLDLALTPGPEAIELVLSLAQPVPPGRLCVRCDGRELIAVDTGASPVLTLPLAEGPRARSGTAALSFAFDPADPERPHLVIAAASLALRAERGHPERPVLYRAERPRMLALGEIAHLDEASGARHLLGPGWQQGGGGARNTTPEAVLRLAPPQGARALVLRFAIEPVLPPVPGHLHRVGVSSGGRMLQVIELIGAGVIEVDLGTPERVDGGPLELTLHSVYVPVMAEGADPGPEDVVQATLELRWLSLNGIMPPARDLAAADGGHGRPLLHTLIDAASDLLDTPEAGIDALIEARAALAAELARLDDRGIGLVWSKDGRARVLGRLGSLVQGVPVGPDDAAVVEEARRRLEARGEPADRLRAFTIGMLVAPAFQLPALADLRALPAVLQRNPALVAEYLGRDPDCDSLAEIGAHVGWLEALLASIEEVVDRDRPGSALHVLAMRVLCGLRFGRTIFGRDNLRPLFRRRARCIEKVLHREGAPLAMPRRPRIGARRLHVGALVRHLGPSPETWAVLAMYRHLDRRRFDLTLVATDAAEGEVDPVGTFARTLRLAERPVEEAVATIRRLDLDILVQNAFFTKWERMSVIAAHRLARLQVNACFNCPTTLGFASFDAALAWAGCLDAAEQHTERLFATDAALQCCFDFSQAAPAAPDRVAARRGLGLPENAVVLASGAMAHKVVPELMAAWAAILARNPDAQLVLYPFAACWSTDFAKEPFRRRLAAALAAAGVPPERARVLDELRSEEVRRVLAAADLYLDSFPYAGATTVCEALAAGLPVVALEGRMLRERTGAAWVRAYDLPDLVAQDEAAYVEAACRLCQDAEARGAAAAQVARVLASGHPPHADSERFGAAFSDGLWRICLESGLFPGLAVAPAAPSSSHLGPGGGVGATMASAPPAVPSRRRGIDPVRAVVLCQPRSGSTLLCELIGAAPGAEMHRELFHRDMIQFQSQWEHDPVALAARDADPLALVERVFEEAEARGARLVGFKLFPFHDARVLRRIAADPGIRLVHLFRENSLAKYSSHRIAELTSRWERKRGAPAIGARVPFDRTDFEAFEMQSRDLEEKILKLLDEAGRDVLRVRYRELLEPEVARRLSDFLELTVPFGRAMRVERQNAPRPIDRFTDRESVRRYLARRGRMDWAFGG